MSSKAIFNTTTAVMCSMLKSNYCKKVYVPYTVRYLEEFDKYITNEQDVLKYHLDCSCATDLKSIIKPLICINAKDDMFISKESLNTTINNVQNKNIIFIRTTLGGHVGWVDNNFDIWVFQASHNYVKHIIDNSTF